jgi:long-chain acyl-CoA synthetase
VREYSVPATVRVGEEENLVDAVYDNAEKYGGTVAYRRRDADGVWSDVTSAQFADQVTAVARGLIASGVGAGDRVALLSRTRFEWTLLDYAILAVGGVTVPIYETSSVEQINWILSDSEAVAVVVESPKHKAAVDSVAGDLPNLARIWQIEPPAAAPDSPGAVSAPTPRPTRCTPGVGRWAPRTSRR